jgi:cyclopropane-fatty-acyl-phospholipid synthase
MWGARKTELNYDRMIRHGRRILGIVMKNNSAKNLFIRLLNMANITPNGQESWDIAIHNEAFYSRVLQERSLGLGESYMDQWWDCEKLDEFFDRVVSADLETRVKKNIRLLMHLLTAQFLNLQTKTRSLEVGKKHYDLGNTLFEAMLDSRMNYTCGYWKNAANLEEAQFAKLKLTCDKLQLKPGMRMLDIGCGWGALLKFAAENYGVIGVGVTISKEQCELAKNRCAGLPIEIRLQDYRDVDESFDRIASLGMFEHVGYKNYFTYMQAVHRNLADDGLFLLHTIGSNVSVIAADEWITKYIFTHGMLPSVSQIGKASENLFIMEDWHNFGADYDKTLMAWHENFINAWPELKKEYDERFFRMWKYYLLSCAGGFRSRSMQLWQIVFSKKGMRQGYFSPR